VNLEVTIPDTFSGPLDLLLDLIRREEMDIRDINVARLAAAYLEELAGREFVDLDEAGEFLSLAARLVEIKGRLLAPPDERPDPGEDEEEGFDPRSGLVEALLEYRRFKEAAERLGEMAAERARRFPRLLPPPDLPPAPPGPADLAGLAAAFQAVLKRRLARPRGRELSLARREIPVADRIAQITSVLAALGRTRFSLLLSSSPDRSEIAAFFIAVLEMIRLGRLIARQADDFTDIILEAREPGPPSGGRPRPRRAARRPLFPSLPRKAAAPRPRRGRLPAFPPGPPGGRPRRAGKAGRRPPPLFPGRRLPFRPAARGKP
jgi:segregation and condensation protein A